MDAGLQTHRLPVRSLVGAPAQVAGQVLSRRRVRGTDHRISHTPRFPSLSSSLPLSLKKSLKSQVKSLPAESRHKPEVQVKDEIGSVLGDADVRKQRTNLWAS